ncbi:hypothetical protein KFL_004550070 [Klebsormidium nitens]|uniref:Phosphoribulokinase/uridine kinase domain-containing protein n=1 Tax=Klebsormidium nitens TaxID=105231 RepID=A0A1Y1IJ49_KLENI|nr:hypothetical protein KFL_004550070 [Klebsormidium nitens]|eukprot:GAQ88736.1 hypothetical protein KFL_004550070 [Klebsormidium nitens]
MALTAEAAVSGNLQPFTARSFHKDGAPADHVETSRLHPGRLRARAGSPLLFSIQKVPAAPQIHCLQKSESVSGLDGFPSIFLERSHSRWAKRKGRCRRVRQHAVAKCESGGSPARFDVAPKMSMMDVFEVLANRLITSAASIPPGQKYMVGVAGSPGSGKTTLARSVTALINSKQSDPDLAVSVPMDGYHLYRKQLDQMPDPKEAHARRGSHWTFDPVGLLSTLKTIREKGRAAVPSFDHGVGDPVDGDIEVKPENRIVIVEGNYLLLDEDHWKDLRDLFDETWFLEVDIDIAMRRVLNRHIKTGKPPDVAAWRVSYNDRPNGLLIAETASRADLVIPSLDMVIGEG